MEPHENLQATPPVQDDARNGLSVQRRSGRTVKRPGRYAPTVQLTRGKRKRPEDAESDEDDDNPSSDDSELSSSESPDEEPDFKTNGKRTGNPAGHKLSRKRTNVKKKIKTGAATTTLPIRTVTRKPGSKSRKPVARRSAAAGDDEGLFGISRLSHTLIQRLLSFR